jgi:dihydrofolate reductase
MSRKAEMPAIAYVVARSYPDKIIGCDNRVPWHIRSDMKRFRSLTEHHAVIMGRKTFDSIGRPLANRLNIVLTRQREQDRENLIWVQNRESALFFADLFSIIRGKKQIYVIGGSEIYRIFEEIFYEIFLTVVMAPDLHPCSNQEFSYFDYEFDRDVWKTLLEEEYPASDADDYPTRFVRLKKKKDIQHRYRDLADFLTRDDKVAEFRARWPSANLSRAIRTEEDLARQIDLFWPEALSRERRAVD